MIIGLGYSIAMPVVPAGALGISGDDPRIGFRVVSFQQREEGWTKVKTDVGVVVDELFPTSRIKDSNGCIGLVAFGMNALVPIVKRLRARFRINYSRPGIFPRRLVEMSVND